MAVRANWKGYLKLSLVSCAVALFPAVLTAQRVRFNILSRRTGHRVRNEVVDSETGTPVAEADRVKGYRLDDGSYVELDDEELDQVALESNHTLDIEAFVSADEVDPVYYDTPYYLVPDDAIAQEAYAVIRDAMAAENVVGLARVVLYRRERIVTITPRGKGLMVRALHYRGEVRDEAAVFDAVEDVRVAPDMVDLAVHIVKSKAGHFDPGTFEDRYDEAVLALIRSKQEGRPPPPPPASGSGNVINLMEALRRSVKSGQGTTAPAAAGPKAKSSSKTMSSKMGSSKTGSSKTGSSKPSSKHASRPPAAKRPATKPSAKARRGVARRKIVKKAG